MDEDIRPPSALLRMMEARVGVEAGQLMMSWPRLLQQAKRGQGETVLVLPGFMADDNSTYVLRQFLSQIGYNAVPWGRGMNNGRMLDHLPPMSEVVNKLAVDGPVRLVGWSRGGIIARELARDEPHLVERVVTIGSPVKGGMSVSSIAPLVQAQTGMSQEEMSQLLRERQRVPITVPVHAMYSKSDGVVAWQACIDHDTANITHHEIEGSHTGMGVNVSVYELLPGLLQTTEHNNKT